MWSSLSPRLRAPALIVAAAGLLAAGLWIRGQIAPQAGHAQAGVPAASDAEKPPAKAAAAPDEGIDFPRESWQAVSLEVEPVRRAPFSEQVKLTGKIALNEDHVAHVFPLVEGRVDEVKVQLGDRVKRGDLMVVVQSKEVGQTMLQLFQDRHEYEFALVKDRWTAQTSTNALAMIKAMRAGSSIEEIESQLRDRPMGEYRDKLMSAYIGLYKSKVQLERLAPLSQGGALPGKQLLEAEAERNASRATLQSLLEQLEQDARQAAIVSAHAVKELKNRVAVDETNLKILGFANEALAEIDPARQGEAISHYPVCAPFDGTIISKDVVLLERVGPQNQILSIADLTSVWVTADIYEEHLPLLEKLANRTISLRSSAWPGRTFEARIFYTGDVVHESTRTISLRAVADNRDGRLKPGMFVDVEFPGDAAQTPVLQTLGAAVQEHEGKTFVFVHVKDDRFERRDVTLGRRSGKTVEIRDGVREGERVVTQGSFALKSRLLADLMGEE